MQKRQECWKFCYRNIILREVTKYLNSYCEYYCFRWKNGIERFLLPYRLFLYGSKHLHESLQLWKIRKKNSYFSHLHYLFWWMLIMLDKFKINFLTKNKTQQLQETITLLHHLSLKLIINIQHCFHKLCICVHV